MLIDLQVTGSEGRAQPLGYEEIRRRLPAGTALIEFGVLDERIVVWVLTRDRLDPRPIDASPDRVRKLVERLEPESRSPQTERFLALRELHELLISPLEDRIVSSDLLVFAPDGILRRVPYAALRDPSGAHLIERFRITVSPGATAFLQALERRQSLGESRPRTLLAISDPAFAREDYPTLHRLSSARAEVAAVAGFYEAEILADADATARRFLDLAGSYQVIHFAGHGIANPELALRSRLVFARDRSAAGSGALYAEEILGRRFERTRLVVLAACATARGPTGRAGRHPGVGDALPGRRRPRRRRHPVAGRGPRQRPAAEVVPPPLRRRRTGLRGPARSADRSPGRRRQQLLHLGGLSADRRPLMTHPWRTSG